MSSSALTSAFDYLERLAVNHRKQLYQQPSTALAIFRRMLPHLAKTIVMAMLYVLDPVPVADLDSWIRSESRREKEQALDLLQRMDMLYYSQEKGKAPTYYLVPPFVTSLRQAITGGGNHKSFGVPFNKQDREKVDITTLDDFARSQWDAILYFVVGSVESGVEVDSSIAPGSKELLRVGNFVNIHGVRASITQEGFEFLLRDINTQVWSLLVVYLNESQRYGLNSIEVLSFLFQLGSLEVKTLEDLHDLGIVYRHPPDSPRFYPTRLAATLNSDSNALSSSLSSALSVGGASGTEPGGFVIVETNYRVYAYTSNPLRIAILSLFIKITAQYPNMITGKLTRNSVQSAISQGITAQQIISYLTTHAHPVMANQSRSNQPAAASGQASHPSLPPTVIDQIRLWQIEGDRMLQTTGYLFTSFSSEAQYRACLEHADTIGVLVWKDDRKRMFFVTRYDQVQAFFIHYNNANKANGAA